MRYAISLAFAVLLVLSVSADAQDTNVRGKSPYANAVDRSSDARGVCIGTKSHCEKPEHHEYENNNRIALVVGNGLYIPEDDLPNPTNDADAVAATLSRHGFNVYTAINLDLRAFRREVNEFISEVRQYDSNAIVVFYYAGHGFEVQDRNYLVPARRSILLDDWESPKEVFIDAQRLFEEIASAGPQKSNLFILDACRTPTLTRGTRGTNAGFTEMSRMDGSLISFSTSVNELASDGIAGGNSPFTIELLDALETQCVDAGEMFINIRNAVEARTSGRQVPTKLDQLSKTFFLSTTACGKDFDFPITGIGSLGTSFGQRPPQQSRPQILLPGNETEYTYSCVLDGDLFSSCPVSSSDESLDGERCHCGGERNGVLQR